MRLGGNGISTRVLTLKVVPRTGDTIADRYILERPVAEGGMGSVWRAKHRTLGRSFAIKFLKPALDGEPLEQRFLREARLSASIQHRFVVDIVDYGVTPDSVPYMVMEFLEGESLDRRGRRLPPLSVRELLRISAEVLLGLEAAHQAGVIHRDLKPENIMLVREADGIIPKLVDFGISRTEVDRLDRRKRLTHPGAFMGTPWYMAPEQARRDEADRRSDIYSMGVILYEAILGEAPFDHPELSALLEAVKLGGAPTLVSRRPELGQELSAVVERAMAVEPASRFESAAELSARLLEIAANVPETLACAEPPVVSRTDTEVLPRPLEARNRTQELTGSRLQQIIPRDRGSRWLEQHRERAVAVAGALLGAMLLTWVATRPRQLPAPLESATVLQTAAQPAMAASSEAVRTAIRSARRDEPSGGSDRTFTTGVGPLEGRRVDHPAGEVRRAGRRPPRHAADGRGRTAVALPDVFRTPGF